VYLSLEITKLSALEINEMSYPGNYMNTQLVSFCLVLNIEIYYLVNSIIHRTDKTNTSIYIGYFLYK